MGVDLMRSLLVFCELALPDDLTNVKETLINR
jgi:hypothetical protein